MPIRPKLFLTFAAVCVSPLLILSLISFFSGIRNTKVLLRNQVDSDVREVGRHYATLVYERERELTTLARGPLHNYVRSAGTAGSVALVGPAEGSPASEAAAEAAAAVRKAIEDLPADYGDVACFDSDKHLKFVSQFTSSDSSTPRTFRTKDFLPGTMEPDEGVWYRKTDSSVRCPIVSHLTFGNVRRCGVPIFLTPDDDPHIRFISTAPRGVLVADMRLAELFAGIEYGLGSPTENTRLNRRVIVLDSSGKIVYHENNALRNQPASTALPEFARVAESMIAVRDSGTGEYRSRDGETWIVAYEPIDVDLSLAVARNYTVATQPARRAGWIGIALSIFFGLTVSALLTFLYQRKTQSLEQVKQSMSAIAHGEFDQELLLRSSDDLRPIADNVNLMTERLREQAAREAEAHQFQSFIKLSALLTHDLKNAIEGLSLTVSNMESHFDDPRFRADAMKGLTSAANKLRGLVARLSNPANTMSGEFKLPRPTDLVPLLQAVTVQIAEPLSAVHEIQVDLPPTLMAMADAERIEKVMENLVLNAVEAMVRKRGRLTIEAGQAKGGKDGGKVFFSVSDTGEGMSPEFMQKRLFHPFATTKTSGVGLGLYTCREVVRANGGTIEVESTQGSGTTFRVVLASAPIKKRD